MGLAVAQVVTNNVVTNIIVVDSAATVGQNGTTITTAGATLPAPSGSIFMIQAGAGIGWTLSGGILSPPAR